MAKFNTFFSDLEHILTKTKTVYDNPDRSTLIKSCIDHSEAFKTPSNALITWTPSHSTGRSPQDTYIVKSDTTEHTVDWHSPMNNPLTEETFAMILEDTFAFLKNKSLLYVIDRVIGANSEYTLPVQLITDRALTSLFADNMFRAVPDDIRKSVFFNDGFTLIVLPYDFLDSSKYIGHLRKVGEVASTMAIVMDMEHKIGIVIGSSYLGTVKKTMFTVANYYLPEKDVLPLHCSANEGKNGDTALLLGLSGTGKTTLSFDPKRQLIGDDEHGWDEKGIFNFENGCYAKLIDLNPEKEPQIYHAVFDERPLDKNGVIIENTMMYPDGAFDLSDNRFTDNSRSSFPMNLMSNIKPPAAGGHPRTILFLTADANGVLPPIARLSIPQAKLWFLMGYTSKLAGTETGITTPVSTFSRFFGAPFMPRNPGDYTSLFGEKLKNHDVQVYMINTGWTGGPYGVGKRIDITVTRALVDAAMDGSLDKSTYDTDTLFHFSVPKECPNVDNVLLNPSNTWYNKEEFQNRAKKLANEFSDEFDNAFGSSGIDEEIRNECPGK